MKKLAVLMYLGVSLLLISCSNQSEVKNNDAEITENKLVETTQVMEETTKEENDEKPQINDVTPEVTFGSFSFKINGEDVNNAKLENLNIYSIEVHTTNSKGVESDNVYTGYKLMDVLNACGIDKFIAVSSVATDGYKSELALGQAKSDWTLVAITKDGKQPDNGTIYIAPCESKQGNVYARDVAEINVD